MDVGQNVTDRQTDKPTDRKTGLMWSKCPSSQELIAIYKYNVAQTVTQIKERHSVELWDHRLY